MDFADIKTEEMAFGNNGHEAPPPVTSVPEEPQTATVSFTPINSIPQPSETTQSVQKAYAPPAAVMTQGEPDNDNDTLFVRQDEPAETTSTPYRITQQNIHNASEILQVSHPAFLTSTKRASTEHGTTAPKKDRKKPKPSIEKYDDHVESKTSNFAIAQDGIIEVIDPVIAMIEELAEAGYSDPVTRAVCMKFKDKRNKRHAETGEISACLLGETGSGKSSLTGSLTNDPDAATECDAGTRGTSTITEYAGTEIGQAEKVRGSVFCVSKRKLEALVAQYVKVCLDWHAQEDDEQDLDETALDELKSCYDTAIAFFHTILCGSADFSTEDATKAFFFNAHFTTTAVTEHLVQRVENLASVLRKDLGALTVAGNTMNEVNEKLKIYRGPIAAAPGAGPVPSLWPLVSKVRIYMDARLLRGGSVLCDMPGTADTNGHIVQMSTDHFQRSSLCIIVGSIKRVQIQESFWDNVRRCLRAGKQYDVILVCTHIDLMKHGAAQKSFSASEQAAIATLKSQFEHISQEIRVLEEERYELDEDDKIGDYMIKCKIEAKELEQSAADARWKEAETMARNNQNIVALQQKYMDVTKVREAVRVICVSNSEYREYMNGVDPKKPPKLSLEGNGIPALRACLLAIPARQRREALLKLCLGDIPILLPGLEMQCLKSRHEQKKALEEYFNNPRSELQRTMSNAKGQIQARFEGMLQDVAYAHEREWSVAARRHHDSWAKYKFPTYGAICRRFGQHKIVKKGVPTALIDWNAGIAHISEEDLLNGFDEVKTALNEVASLVLGEVDGSLRDLEMQLSDCPELVGHDEDIQRFSDDIVNTRAVISQVGRKLFSELDTALNLIRYNATDVKADGSNLKSSMATTYEACNARKKAGKHGGPGTTFNDMKSIMSMQLYGPDNVFNQVISSAQIACWKVVEQWHVKAFSKIARHLDVIVNNFHNRFDNDEPEDEVKRASRQKLLVTVRESWKTWETKLLLVAKQVEPHD
ncbi:hypothetical protein LTS12_015833 [Elasticomyces elasticus]|nr:hypothetical protein LTS12_015833 [Elasticomyces elasticus]